jgi:uncharacterized protein (TIGR00725 family)
MGWLVDNRTEKLRPFPSMAIGVMGSAGGKLEPEVIQLIRHLGAVIALRGHVLLTGACPGLPHEAAIGAKLAGGIVVGISPALNLDEHIRKYRSPTRGYDTIIYTGSGLMGREIENIRSCDAVIFAGGRSGTLGEFAIAYDEGKVIGALVNSGGITEHLQAIIEMVNKDTGATISYDEDPERLIKTLEGIYRETIYSRHKKLINNHNPDGEPGE